MIKPLSRTLRWLAALAVGLGFPSVQATAQVCEWDAPIRALRLGATHIDHGRLGPAGLGGALGILWTLRQGMQVDGSIGRIQFERGAVHDIRLGASLALPFALCLTSSVWASQATAINNEDSFRNISLPAGLTIGGKAGIGAQVVRLRGGPMLVFSATNASLFSFAMREHSLSAGAAASAATAFGRVVTEVRSSYTRLPGNLGLQPLGRYRTDFVVWMRF